MDNNRFHILLLLISICASSIFAQQVPFSRGINLTSWFQAASARQIHFTRYTKTDFKQIKSLGCDVIRLPINLHFMTSGSPDYRIDPLFYGFLDEVINWAEEMEINLILDNHTFDPAAETDPNVGQILEKIWKQMAWRYKERSHYIYYEILNEPHGISDALWNTIQQKVVKAIRTIDTTHTIIVGPAGWNSYNNLDEMPVYDDDNLIYTFHFYDPFLFTHQGATWVDPSLQNLANVPFPYQADQMPSLPQNFKGTWIESAYNNYSTEGSIVNIEALIDIAVQFRDQRNVPVFCGEFGVYIPNSNDEDRVFWYEKVRSYLEENQIAWTSWDYHGGFGLFLPEGNNLFEHDLNIPLIEALGFNSPPQTEFVIHPDSQGFFIYSDYIGKNIVEASYTDGTLDYYSMDQPNYGDHCVYWTGAKQYQAISFDLKPNRDLSYLVEAGFALDLLARGDKPDTRFDIRFLDTKTNVSGDRPWRMRFTIDETNLSMNNQWQHLHIPLANFIEHGAWDENTWFTPQGDFDWSAIDRLEIVSEYSDLGTANLWFDHIQLTDQDTSRINNNTTSVSNNSGKATDLSISVFPNPSMDFLTIQCAESKKLDGQLLDNLGRIVLTLHFQGKTMVDLSGLPSGLYLLRLSNPKHQIRMQKILKL